ncbi:class I SAM-dependent methyltransferase [Croceicoccus sp. YJ47]|uniref:class I SAM-dependent methyltransferase n=1 Tax=Croceicoccus sp. YJ47 TaxID=2798724 RepID=UPI001924ED43|nr:SAM-dependent methyltransferase [Croceicoccus sp. YJ47]QQN73065.1 SAM-dependent methyltransferase [Croceicoccus sp. YJ47]
MNGDTNGGDLTAGLRRLIRAHGPIPVAQYMAEANAHYYAHRDPLGTAGDFITAPEISQMFGEMIGGWIADLTIRAEARDFAYVELGPGRGTLARDALRVIRAAGLSPTVHLVEASPVLREKQAELVPDAQFHEDVAALPTDRPVIVVANEFFDALPVRQLVRTGRGWRERMVGLDGDAFVTLAGDRPMDAAVPPRHDDAEEGTLIETNPAAAAILGDLAKTIAEAGGAMLTIDYGHLAPRTGSTLQAVRAHEKVDVLDAPGTADITAHVDFPALIETAERAGCVLHGTASQGVFLMALGMGQRAQALAEANPHARDSLLAALERLTAPDAMGDLFKVMAFGASGWPEGAGVRRATPA